MSGGRDSSTESTIGLHWSKAKWECGAPGWKIQEKPSLSVSFSAYVHACACLWASLWELASYLIHHSGRAVLTGNCRCSQAVLCSKPSHHWARGTCCMHVLDPDSQPTCVSLLGQGRKRQKSLGQARERECIGVEAPNPCACPTGPLDFTYRTQTYEEFQQSSSWEF